MFSNQQSATRCAECKYWSFKHSDCVEHGELGECRRHPPIDSEAIQIATLENFEEESQRYQSEEKRYLEWQGRQEKKYSELRSKIEQIEKTIETSLSEQEISNWVAEKEEQQKRINTLLSEKYERPEWFEKDDGKVLTSAKRGKWLLTSSEDWCGEWKKR